MINLVNDDIVEAFQTLIPQLTEYSPPPNRMALESMAASETTFVFLARQADPESRIIGTATLVAFRTPTGVHGWIEDVVVDQGARRQGVGRALTEACLEKACQLELREVNLTSRPSRIAANQLYQELGFVQRETNLYTYSLK